MNTALRQSEESHIERTMLDDKLAATDWEATQDELIQQIARESYLQWLCDTSQPKKDEKTVRRFLRLFFPDHYHRMFLDQ